MGGASVKIRECLPGVITEATAIAMDFQSLFKECQEYRVSITDPSSTAHVYRFKGTALGKMSLTGILEHSVWEEEYVAGVRIKGGTSVEVLSITDFKRGNSVSVSAAYADAEGESYAWKFWWGDDKVTGNRLHDSVFYFAAVLGGGSGSKFRGNTIMNSTLTIDNDDWRNPGPVEGLKGQMSVEGLQLSAGSSMTLTYNTAYVAGHTWSANVSDVVLRASSLTVRANQGITLANVRLNDFTLSEEDSGVFMDNFSGSTGGLTVTGDNTLNQLMSWTDCTVSNGTITADPPTGATCAFEDCTLDGWTVTLNDSGHTGLRLSRRAMSGRTVYDSNLSVEKDATDINDYDGTTSAGVSPLLKMAGPYDAYAGEFVVTGLSTTSISPTIVSFIGTTHAFQGRRIRVKAGYGAAQGYLRFTFSNAQSVNPMYLNGLVGQTTVNVSSNVNNVGGSAVFTGEMGGGQPFWILDSTQVLT